MNIEMFLAVNALEMMRQHDITQLLVLDDKKYIGIIMEGNVYAGFLYCR